MRKAPGTSGPSPVTCGVAELLRWAAMKRLEVVLFAAALLALACDSSESKSSSAPPPNTAAPAPVGSGGPSILVVATPGQPATFASADGAALSGELFLSPEPNAPALILVHRLDGDRQEFAPLIKKLVLSPKRFTILSFDLRGHGASKAPAKEKQGDHSALSKDVEAAIKHVSEAAKPRAIVLVGTSIGCALVSEVAFAEPKVTALGLVSPGEAISGHPLYRPYAEVRNLATFIAGAKDDTVAKAPLDALEKMAMRGTVKRYEGARHSAHFLGEEHSELWDDLETWAMSVFAQEPTERRSLYLAPGKEPKKIGPGAVPKKPGKTP